jgi:hypothetical protein
MTDKVLIINGIISTDDLPMLGIDVAKKYQNADKVYIIDYMGCAKQIKYKHSEGVSNVNYIDANAIRKKIRRGSV